MILCYIGSQYNGTHPLQSPLFGSTQMASRVCVSYIESSSQTRGSFPYKYAVLTLKGIPLWIMEIRQMSDCLRNCLIYTFGFPILIWNFIFHIWVPKRCYYLSHWDWHKMADILQTTWSNSIPCICFIRITLKFVSMDLSDSKPALVQIMALWQTGDKSLFEAMMA